MDALNPDMIPAPGESSEMDKSIDAMDAELLAGPEIYHPSRLWQDLNRQNTEQLRRGGIENFKRSINQNYFNFLPLTLGDAQLFRLMRDAVRHGRLPLPRSSMRDPDLAADGGLLPAKERLRVSYGDADSVMQGIGRVQAATRWPGGAHPTVKARIKTRSSGELFATCP